VAELGIERPVKVGLAGLGRFGKLHASILASLPGVRLEAISDPLQAEVASLSSAYSVPLAFDSFRAMLTGANLDCVFIVTPEDLHAEMVRDAVESGLPTFVEKPLATKSSIGAGLSAAAREARVHLQVGFVLRFESLHATLKSEIDGGKFGRIVTVHAKRNCTRQWFDDYGDRAHSVHETIIHDIDLLLWLLRSRCERVYAAQRFISGHKFPDATVAMLQFADGTVALMETSWLVPERAPANVLTDDWHGTIDSELEIIGEHRTARLKLLESGLEIWADDVPRHPEVALWPEINGRIGGALRAEDAYFIEAVRAGSHAGITSVEDAVHGLQIAEAIIESANECREVAL
jgi:myo-inositol 2-dehydrogenase / D-chiro-inositol 1-dehydrogenase